MGKFLDKKERVIDFKLTSYGKHMLANGDLKPIYYAFFDDNVIYDGAYVNITESQNNINNRIKNETQYLEGQVLFEDVENLPNPNSIIEESGSYVATANETSETKNTRKITFKQNATPTYNLPRKDVFRFEQMIGDAFLEGDTQSIPAWKVAALDGRFDSILQKDNTFPSSSLEIPQINIEANYRLKVGSTNTADYTNPSPDLFETDINYMGQVLFNNNEYIYLERDDMTFYIEELNTILLNSNFEIEVFEVTSSVLPDDTLIKKQFKKDFKSLNGGNITEEYLNNLSAPYTQPTPDDVEYYFNVYKDHSIDAQIACKGAEIFNKDSYYIDLDFDCTLQTEDGVYFDIYGPVTEPEICQ